MGATGFTTHSAGKTPQEAFASAVQEALYWEGHGGYTGTIAEKMGWEIVARPPRISAKKVEKVIIGALYEYNGKEKKFVKQLEEWYGVVRAKQIMDLYEDKWGEAICMEASPAEEKQYFAQMGPKKRGERLYSFFGLASC